MQPEKAHRETYQRQQQDHSLRMVLALVARIKHRITCMNIARYCSGKSSAIRGAMQCNQQLYIDASHRHSLCTPPSLPPSHTSALMDMFRELFWKFPKQPSMTSVPGRTTPQDRVSQMTLNTRYTPSHPHPGQHTYLCHVLLVSFAFKLTDDPPGRTRPLEKLNHKEHAANTKLLKRK